ncbi:MAG: restriction endonuclease [Candidatus Synoicihabitans palmerolidicus]|nr:restriction endonuclease [Candidatus Synoicihabitans palmerolidicus]
MSCASDQNAGVFCRQFEELSLQLVHSQFKIEPSLVLLTPPAQDGGFDGVVRCTLSDPDKFGLDLNILLEAKLRSKTQSLELRSFATSLIVAYNRDADILVIVCNQRYSPQAIEEAHQFTRTTRMKIQLVDGEAVVAWVRSRMVKLKRRYAAHLSIGLYPVARNRSSIRSIRRNFDLTPPPPCLQPRSTGKRTRELAA